MKPGARASLLRIDDRLLHGQVLVAWAAALRPDRIVLASDTVAADAERRALYEALPQDDYRIVIATLVQAAAELAGAPPVIVVCASPHDALQVVAAGAGVQAVQVGGLHDAPGKTRILDYVHVSAADRGALRALAARGVAVIAQDLPTTRAVTLDPAAWVGPEAREA